MNRLRNAPVGIRLAMGFGVVCVLLLVVAGTGLWSASSQHAAQVQIVEDDRIAVLATELKFRAADMNGWQTAYAFDATTGVAGATDDTKGNRRAFLVAVDALREDLRRLRTLELSAVEVEEADKIERAFEKFVSVDEQIIVLYRRGTPTDVTQATGLVLGEELVHFQAIAAAAERLDVAAERDSARSEASGNRTASRARLLMILIGALALLAAAGLATAITKSLTGPLKRTVDVLRAVAAGDLTTRVDATSDDEIGQMGSALDDTLNTLRGTVAAIAGSSSTLSASSEELSAVSQQMSAAAEETAAQAATVSAAAEQVSSNLQSVSAGAEELGSSVQEIARNTSDAASVATKAVAVAQKTDLTVRQLGTSSSEIGDVIKVITSIAEQTNLLALNATIEAARAGDAGKGFAVVANEVKELARKTARSSEEIAQKIESIQSDSRQAIDAIAEIAEIIGQINDIQTVIAASVEEQAATTNEIGRSVTEAAEGSSEIARNITGVAEAARGATEAAAETHRSAEDLSRLASELLAVVSQFRVSDQGESPSVPVAPWQANGSATRSYAHSRS